MIDRKNNQHLVLRSGWVWYAWIWLLHVCRGHGENRIAVPEQGHFDSKQIVSASWIEEMTSPRTVESNRFRGMDYGYLWWIIDRKKDIYAAIGNSGNVIYINPEKNTVVAMASYFKPSKFDKVDFIQEYIEISVCE